MAAKNRVLCFSCWGIITKNAASSMCSLAGCSLDLKVFGPWRSGRQSLTCAHTNAQHFKVQHWVYCLPCESQDCSRKAPWDSLSAEKVSKASSWPKVNTPEYVLAWLNMDEALIGPRGLLFFSFQLLFPHAPVIALTSSPVDGRCAGARAPLCICRGVLLHIWERLRKVIFVF